MLLKAAQRFNTRALMARAFASTEIGDISTMQKDEDGNIKSGGSVAMFKERNKLWETANRTSLSFTLVE